MELPVQITVPEGAPGPDALSKPPREVSQSMVSPDVALSRNYIHAPMILSQVVIDFCGHNQYLGLAPDCIMATARAPHQGNTTAVL